MQSIVHTRAPSFLTILALVGPPSYTTTVYNGDRNNYISRSEEEIPLARSTIELVDLHHSGGSCHHTWNICVVHCSAESVGSGSSLVRLKGATFGDMKADILQALPIRHSHSCFDSIVPPSHPHSGSTTATYTWHHPPRLIHIVCSVAHYPH